MVLTAPTHLIQTRYDTRCKYRPFITFHVLDRPNDFWEDHVISHVVPHDNYVTGFAKTLQLHARIEIRFIACLL